MAKSKKSAKPAKKTKAKSVKAKKSTASKVVISKKASPVNKPFTKTEILGEIAGMTELTQKQVGGVMESLQHVIERHLKKGAVGVFVLPGLLKCVVVHKPATKARKGINPFTGEPTVFKAKPARNLIKVKGLKKLKEMVS